MSVRHSISSLLLMSIPFQQIGSSEESVGGVGLRQIAEGMIKGDFSDAEGAESVSFSHGELGLVVEALDDAAGELLSGAEIIED